MITSLPDWAAFLRSTDTIIGLPLILSGLGMMFFGWRLWKGCVVISFGLIGFGLGVHFFDSHPQQLWFSLAIAAALAALSYWPVNYSLALLGGLVGAATLMEILTSAGFMGSVLWILVGLALFSAAALAFINRQLVVIALTAFEGSVLLVSGIAAVVMTMPALDAVFSEHSGFAVAFGLLVPTVMSCFYQVAEVHRLNRRL